MGNLGSAIAISLTVSVVMVGLSAFALSKYESNSGSENAIISKIKNRAENKKITLSENEIKIETSEANRRSEAIRFVNGKINECLSEYREKEDRRYGAEQARAENDFVNSTRGMSWNQMRIAYGMLAESVQRQTQAMENNHIMNYRRIYGYCGSNYPCPGHSEREANNIYCVAVVDQ